MSKDLERLYAIQQKLASPEASDRCQSAAAKKQLDKAYNGIAQAILTLEALEDLLVI